MLTVLGRRQLRRRLPVITAAALSVAALSATLASAYTPAPPEGPAVQQVTPNNGPAEGGNRVVLSGTLIQNARSIVFGPEQATIVERSASTLTVIAPAGLSGTTVQVWADPGASYRNTQTSAYTYAGPTREPVKLSPARGTPLGGNEVTVTAEGVDFAGAKAVTFGKKTAQIVRSSATSVTVLAPAGAPKSKAQVSVQTADGDFHGIQTDLYTYNANSVPPTITSVSPTSSRRLDTRVTVIGTQLEEATEVTIGGQSVSFYDAGPEQLSFWLPRQAPGTVDIVVTTTAGTSANTAADDFTYLPVPDPPVIESITPGTVYESDEPELVIKGRNLAETEYVRIINNERDITYRSESEIRLRPVDLFIPGSYRPTLYTPGGGTQAPEAFVILNDPPGPAPKPLTLTPSHATLGSSPIIVLSGAATDIDFAHVGQVKLGGEWVEVLGTTSTSVTIRPYAWISGTQIQIYSRQADRRQLNTDEDVFRWDPVLEETPTPTPTPDPLVGYDFSLAGSSQLKTLTKGTVPLAGSIKSQLELDSGDFTADLVLNNTRAKLTIVGLIPVTANVAFVQSGQTTGSLKSGVLTTSSKTKIRLPQVYLFGAIPLAGSNCQTRQYSTINLTSTEERFQPLVGGPLSGTYAISDLTGCGALNGIISPLTAGGGNTINVNLTPTN